jgi:hypothetical protein
VQVSLIPAMPLTGVSKIYKPALRREAHSVPSRRRSRRCGRRGRGPGLELFEVRGPDQRPAVRFSDFGLQHFALYVDDLDLATERFVAAGGTMFSGPNEMEGLEKCEGNRWRYGRTPWGSVIELISSPSPQAYERDTPLRRWKPPA